MTNGAFPSRRAVLIAGGGAVLAACGGRTETRILVGSGAGSASDTLARIFAEHLGGRRAGVVVENVPRGGGKVAAARLSAAAGDGATMAFLPTGLLYSSVLSDAGEAWDLAQFAWVAGFGSDRRALVVTAKANVRDFDALRRRRTPVTLAAASAASPGYYEPAIIRHLTAAPLRVVPGFVGGARNLSLLSGETDGLVGSIDGMGPILRMPGSRLILRLTDYSGEAGCDDVPTLATVSAGADAVPLIRLIEAHARLGRILAMPPRTSPEVLASVQARVAAVLRNATFVGAAAARRQVIEPVTGRAVQAIISDILKRHRAVTSASLHRAMGAT